MTKDEVLELYKERTGRKWRDDRPIDGAIKKLEELGIEVNLEEEVKEPEKPKVVQAEVINKGENPPPSRGVSRFKQYRVFFKGNEMWWSKAIIESALKNSLTASQIEFPVDTDFESSATLNKCKSC